MTVEYGTFRTQFRDRAHAASYDRTRFGGLVRALRERRWRRVLRRLLREIAPRGLVLDLPCGTGRLAPLFRDTAIASVGADLSVPMLGEARRKGAGFLLAGDAERLPLKDGAVDGVVSLRFMSHPPPDARAKILAEMARVARRFVLLDCRYRNALREALRRAGGRPRKERSSLEALAAEIAAAGFVPQPPVRLSRLFSDNALLLAWKRG